MLPKITGNVQNIPLNKEILKIPKNIQLSDPNFDKPAEIDVLIGAELIYDLLNMNRIPLSVTRTSLQSTKLGWIVAGKVNDYACRRRFSSNLIRDPLNIQLKNFWKLGNVHKKDFYQLKRKFVRSISYQILSV